MHSRLYKRVLNKYDWVHNCTAFNSLYNHTGLVGIFISGQTSRAPELLSILCKELQVLPPLGTTPYWRLGGNTRMAPVRCH